MYKIIAKWAIIGLLILLVLSSVAYNVFILVRGYQIALQQQGANIAVAQITSTVRTKGLIELPFFNPDGTQGSSIFLIEKPANGTKK